MEPDEPDFDTPQELVAHIQEECQDGGPYVFRGINCELKRLPDGKKNPQRVNSGLFREYKNENIFNPHFQPVDIEREIVDRARAHVPSGTTNVDILTDLRHFGADTTLIDFSHNLFVALYIACAGEVEQTGTLIALPTGGVTNLADIDYATRGKEIALLRPARTPLSRARVEFQSSIFVHTPQGWIPEDTDYKSFCIPSMLKNTCLRYLHDFHNIRQGTIYNDLIGFIQNEENFKTAELFFYRGRAAQRIGDHHAAIEYYNEAVRLNPGHASSYNNRGISNKYLERFKEAIADYGKAIDLEPDFVEAYSNRSKEMMRVGRHKEAIADCDRAIDLNPKLAEAYCDRGTAKAFLCQNAKTIGNHYEAARYFEEALADFNEAIHLKPDHADAYSNRGAVKMRLAPPKLEEAIADYSEVIRLRSDNAAAYFGRGVAKWSFDKKKIDEVRDDLKTAIELAEKKGNRDLAEQAQRALSALDD